MDDDAIVAALDTVWRTCVREPPRELVARWRARESDVEHRFTVTTPATRELLMVLCERFGLKLYRAPRARWSSMSVDGPPGFMAEVFAPLLKSMAPVIEEHVLAVTSRIITQWSARVDEKRADD